MCLEIKKVFPVVILSQVRKVLKNSVYITNKEMQNFINLRKLS